MCAAYKVHSMMCAFDFDISLENREFFHSIHYSISEDFQSCMQLHNLIRCECYRKSTPFLFFFSLLWKCLWNVATICHINPTSFDDFPRKSLGNHPKRAIYIRYEIDFLYHIHVWNFFSCMLSGFFPYQLKLDANYFVCFQNVADGKCELII